MSAQEFSTPRTIFIGKLTRDFFILPDGKVSLDVPGGGVLYSAVGYSVWEPDPPPGLVARVGNDFPPQWLDQFRTRGMDARGVRVLQEPVDVRSFYVFKDRVNRVFDDPVAHFARLEKQFPPSLLGYRLPRNPLDSRTQLNPTSIRQGDLPSDFLDASAAHIAPVDFLTQTLIPAVLRQNGFNTITLDPSPGMMTPIFWDDIPAVLTGLTAFIPSELELRALFQGRSTDIWEMMQGLAGYGNDFIVVKRGESGQFLYDATSRTRWEIPAYPSRLANGTGAGDAFCGGFLAGYRKTFDPVQAVLYGNIAASLVVEGDGVFFALDALPSLALARLEALRDTVRRL
jgi:sugar/nucleoside kinase (ribokinase family)